LRFVVSIVLASTLICGSAHAKNDQIQRGGAPKWVVPSELLPVPEEASGLLFVRRQDTLVHLDEQGQEQYIGYRIKILHPSALQLGNLSIAWNPESGAPTVHTVKLYRGAETIDVLQTTSFETLRREGQLEAAMLDGVLTGVVRISDLRVGDELEVAYTTRFSDPTLGNANSGLLFLQSSTAPGRFHLGLSWVEGQKPNIKMTDDMAAVVQKDERSVGFRFDNPANLALAKDAPPRYNWKRVVEYSDFSNWNAISQRFAGLYMKASKLSDTSPLKREAKQIASANLSPFDRATAALKLVQQDVRYIYVGLGNGNLTPVAADDTWQRRYGDCKGKTALLLGLLAELGIDAEPVLASNAGSDDGLDQRLPNPQMFDHVLVRARIDGKLYFLDATLPPVVPPSFNPVFPYRWVLPLRMKGSSIERLEWRPTTAPDELTLYEIDARTGFSTPARITSTTITRGIKGLEQQVQLSALTPSGLLDAMRQQMVGDTWQVIDDVKWRFDQKAQASVLTISGTGTVDWDDDGKGAKSLALPGGGFYPPAKHIRAAGQEQNLPYYNEAEYSCHVTTVRLPSDTQARQWSFKPGIDTRLFGKNYYRAFELRDGAIRMIRGGRIEQQEIDAASAKRDNDRIASFDNSMAWIYYNPSERGSPARGDKAVPATYDIDWTTDGVPCVSNNSGK
jgi:Domain of Unknown Function with PDB structure (DUF3857)